MTKAINVKVDDKLWQRMKKHDEINWSGVIRNSIRQKIETISQQEQFDHDLAAKAFHDALDIRKKKLFQGRSGTDIIREWRDRKK